MGKIVAGIGTSHIPSVGPVYDNNRQNEPDWKPMFDGYKPVKKWLKDEAKPDTAIVIYNDHGSDFALDRVPTFAIGVRENYELADEGHGLRPLPNIRGNPDLSWHLVDELIHNEFDMTVCQEMKVDHGLVVPMPLLFSHDPDWDVKVVPIVVNVIQHPLPTNLRCFKLGQAIRKAVESFPADERVAIIGTGGMSHQLHGERFGHINSDFDRKWLDLIERDPQALLKMSHKEIMAEAGAESVALIMWLTMRGALTENVKRQHVDYYAPIATGVGVISMYDA